ncbi:MAG: SOS response-associated peptidase [Idiomarina sp.]|nr:SOS response-associated peptidase [Idiomarina sp.]
MCGRLDVIANPLCEEVWDQLGLDFTTSTNRDLRPTQRVDVVGMRDHQLHQITTEWGIQPGWAKRIIINAQSETVASKPTFKNAFRLHRCIVPCSGWYEWQQLDGQSRKLKYRFRHAEDNPLYMAGIFYPVDGDSVKLVTLTTKPRVDCAKYHHRMPLLVRPAEVLFWLNSDAPELEPLLQAPEEIPLTINRADN